LNFKFKSRLILALLSFPFPRNCFNIEKQAHLVFVQPREKGFKKVRKKAPQISLKRTLFSTEIFFLQLDLDWR